MNFGKVGKKRICGWFFWKISGIKVPKTGKTARGLCGASARCRVVTARIEVGIARSGVRTGQPGSCCFSTRSRQLWRTSGKNGVKCGSPGHFRPFPVTLWRCVCTAVYIPALFAGRNTGNSDVVSCRWGCLYSAVSSGFAFFFRVFLASSCLAVLVFSIF